MGLDMTEDEIAAALKENVGKRVKVRSTRGEFAILEIVWFDGEGCTCKVTHPDYDPNATYWWAVDEIEEVSADPPS
jgi:hypothetical protein